MLLKDKVAFITGGASGLGAQTARALCEQGVHVALFDREQKESKKLAEEIEGLAFEGDVADEASVKSAIQEVVAKWGSLHVVISCAGIVDAGRVVGREGPLALSAFEKVIRVNLMGTFNVLRLAAAQMEKQQAVNEDGERGVIINTSSVAAWEGQIGQVAYFASKGGVASLTLPAARELAAYGIRVVTIAPGVMETPMVEGMSEKVQKSLEATIPFPKRLGSPHEFASLVSHIIENNYLNGSTIRLDGALRMEPK